MAQGTWPTPLYLLRADVRGGWCPASTALAEVYYHFRKWRRVGDCAESTTVFAGGAQAEGRAQSGAAVMTAGGKGRGGRHAGGGATTGRSGFLKETPLARATVGSCSVHASTATCRRDGARLRPMSEGELRGWVVVGERIDTPRFPGGGPKERGWGWRCRINPIAAVALRASEDRRSSRVTGAPGRMVVEGLSPGSASSRMTKERALPETGVAMIHGHGRIMLRRPACDALRTPKSLRRLRKPLQDYCNCSPRTRMNNLRYRARALVLPEGARRFGSPYDAL